MSGNARQLILQIVETDRTFEQKVDRFGQKCWIGRCIHCNTALVVGLDGSCGREVTIEHIIPRGRGGDDRLQNLALACNRCNHTKGHRQDMLKPNHPDFQKMVTFLQQRRQERWREPTS